MQWNKSPGCNEIFPWMQWIIPLDGMKYSSEWMKYSNEWNEIFQWMEWNIPVNEWNILNETNRIIGQDETQMKQ